MITEKISHCPLCGSAKAEFHSIPLSNLYSEKMASVSGENEEDLLRHFKNVICQECGLIYKQEAYPEALIQAIFKEVVPDHPKGWDVMSGRFNPDNFYQEIDTYNQAILSNDTEQINRFRRALLSIVDSIFPHEPNEALKLKLNALIVSQDITGIRALQDAVFVAMKEPMPFKRFSGFSSSLFWAYLEEKLGGIDEYDEMGCPLWGMLSLAKAKGIDARFVRRPEVNYWSENCKRNNTHCVQWLHDTHHITLSDWHEQAVDEKRQVIGFFQYLDHLSNPGNFLSHIFQQYDAAAVILDGVNEPVYIQHITGWTDQSIAYVARQFQKKVYTDFELIEPSGNRLFLFA